MHVVEQNWYKRDIDFRWAEMIANTQWSFNSMQLYLGKITSEEWKKKDEEIMKEFEERLKNIK